MRDVLVLIYSTLLGRQPGTNPTPKNGDELVGLWSSEPWLPASRYLRIGARLTSYANESAWSLF